MGSDQTNNAKLGIFVIAAALLFSVAVYYIGNQQNLFGSKVWVSAVFQNINGLQKGNNVRYSGINVGNVDNIEILNDSMIRVDMLLDESVQKFLKTNAIASIGSDGLVGNMIVNITPGKGVAPVVNHGSMITSYSRVEADDMLGTLGKTTENIELLSRNLLEISENMLEGDGSISKLINDAQLANELTLTFKNLRKASDNMQLLGIQLVTTIEDANKGEGVLGYLLTDSLFGQQMTKISYALDTLIDYKTAPIMDNLNQATEDIVESSTQLKELLETIDLNKGLAGSVLNDQKAASDFKETLQNLNQGTDRFNDNMEALKHNFLFRGYFNKLDRKAKRDARKKMKSDSLITAKTS